ncbi:hypothetical protein MCHI_003468 [Candidatus Magnetoovum chiemensis]|nr:hypothetical protein MCHI_003468 [Candidatus Magnetoovum chiemensis]
MKKLIITLMFVFAFVIASSQAFADAADDETWIKQCIADNANENQSADTLKIYCECMNDKMPEEEMQSITEWEKSHPKEEAECDAKSGWKK